MLFSPKPIQAYFGEANTGRNHWGYWAAGLWFTVFVWFIGNIFAGLPMVAGIATLGQEALQEFMQSASGAEGGSGGIGGFFGLSIVAIILYFIQNSFGERNRKAVLIVAGICAAASVYFIWQMIKSTPPDAQATLMKYMGQSPLVYMGMLIVFPFIALGLYIAQRVLHQRSIRSLHTAAKSYRWGRMFFAMVVFWILAGSMSAILHVTGVSPAKIIFDPKVFWGFFVASLLFIPLQSATEEIMLRGYLNQGLSRFIKNPWIIFFITSAGFAALHLGNPEVAQASAEGNKLLTVSGYFFFGFFACVLTYIDGGLESAIGIHAANNLFAASVVGYEHSALPTPTIFRVGFNSDADVIYTILGLMIVCLVMYKTRRNTPGLSD